MNFGVFEVPYTMDYELGKRTPKQIIDWGLEVVGWADQFGFSMRSSPSTSRSVESPRRRLI